jgi:hypothetical protein
MTEVLVKEQAAAQRDRFASFRLLERIAEALERSSPRQAGVVPTEEPAAIQAMIDCMEGYGFFVFSTPSFPTCVPVFLLYLCEYTNLSSTFCLVT